MVDLLENPLHLAVSLHSKMLLTYLYQLCLLDDSIVVGIQLTEQRAKSFSLELGNLLQTQKVLDYCYEVVASLDRTIFTWYF